VSCNYPTGRTRRDVKTSHGSLHPSQQTTDWGSGPWLSWAPNRICIIAYTGVETVAASLRHSSVAQVRGRDARSCLAALRNGLPASPFRHAPCKPAKAAILTGHAASELDSSSCPMQMDTAEAFGHLIIDARSQTDDRGTGGAQCATLSKNKVFFLILFFSDS